MEDAVVGDAEAGGHRRPAPAEKGRFEFKRCVNGAVGGIDIMIQKCLFLRNVKKSGGLKRHF